MQRLHPLICDSDIPDGMGTNDQRYFGNSGHCYIRRFDRGTWVDRYRLQCRGCGYEAHHDGRSDHYDVRVIGGADRQAKGDFGILAIGSRKNALDKAPWTRNCLQTANSLLNWIS